MQKFTNAPIIGSDSNNNKSVIRTESPSNFNLQDATMCNDITHVNGKQLFLLHLFPVIRIIIVDRLRNLIQF